MADQRVAIVTDSTSDLAEEICAEHGIAVVPLSLTIADETMLDRSISMAEFFERMNAAPELPTTSQPALGAFMEAYERALETASQVVSVHISSKLSGTFSVAKRAAEEFAGRVHVVDSENLSWGLGFQVLEAAKAARSGLDSQGVVERVERVRDRVQLLVGVDSLDNMVKGGRVNRLMGAVGGALNVKVTVSPSEGELHLVKAVRGKKKAWEFGVDWIEEKMQGAKRGAFCVMHAMSEDSLQWFKREIENRFEPTELYTAETGTVIATHTGSGWGVAFVPED